MNTIENNAIFVNRSKKTDEDYIPTGILVKENWINENDQIKIIDNSEKILNRIYDEFKDHVEVAMMLPESKEIAKIKEGFSSETFRAKNFIEFIKKNLDASDAFKDLLDRLSTARAVNTIIKQVVSTIMPVNYIRSAKLIFVNYTRPQLEILYTILNYRFLELIRRISNSTKIMTNGKLPSSHLKDVLLEYINHEDSEYLLCSGLSIMNTSDKKDKISTSDYKSGTPIFVKRTPKMEFNKAEYLANSIVVNDLYYNFSTPIC